MQRNEQRRPRISLSTTLLIIGGILSLSLVIFRQFKIEYVGPIDRIPPATPTPTPVGWTPTLEELATNELKKLSEGRIVFNPPTTMQQGQDERIEARISLEDIGGKLTEGLKGRGLPEIQAIKVGSLMKVSLYAEKDVFHITNLSSEQQIVSGRPFAQWDWTVTPLDYGTHSLSLRATATVVLQGLGEKSVDVPVIDKRVNVRVSPRYIVKGIVRNPTAWQIVFGGGVGVLLVGGIYASIRKYRTKKQELEKTDRKKIEGFVPAKKKVAEPESISPKKNQSKDGKQ